jgi:hypothetical protein
VFRYPVRKRYFGRATPKPLGATGRSPAVVHRVARGAFIPIPKFQLRKEIETACNEALGPKHKHCFLLRDRGSSAGAAAFGRVVKLQLLYLPAQRVPVDTQHLGGPGLIAVVPLEYPLNKPLLEFRQRIGIKDSVVNHSVDEGFKLVFHGSAPVGEEILLDTQLMLGSFLIAFD